MTSHPFPTLASKAILSPMAGVTDVAFRALCKKYGAGMTCTEFVSSAALVRGSIKTKEMLATDQCERPVAVQLFGSDEKEIVGAARLVEGQFDIIDMNCGCPAWKVIKTGAGSALLNDPQKIYRFVKNVSSAVKVPVTVKIRSGIDENNINAVEVAMAAQRGGAAAIAVHGRTQKQGYRGFANWDVIRDVKQAVSIPVIGNGDVFCADDFFEKLEYSGCDYILIARGAIGNPGIFEEITARIERREPRIKSKREYFLEYLALAQKHKVIFAHVKNHAISFTKGIEGGARIREKLARVSDIDSLRAEFEK